MSSGAKGEQGVCRLRGLTVIILTLPPFSSGVSYNIWYNKWSGGDRDDHNKHKAETRCDIARDSGYTRGDAQKSTTICLFFARGCCPQGSDCTFLHRLPRAQTSTSSQSHTATKDQGLDIFGREKHGDYRDDMGGVGSIQRVNRTLYVGKIHEEVEDLRKVSSGGGANSSLPGGPSWRDGGRTVKGGKSVGQVKRDVARRDDANAPPREYPLSATEKVLRRHFGEWGDIERVRVLHHRGCAFVTYLDESHAQFAKEAMMNQSLDHDEIINVRWATDDPNPAAAKREKRRMEEEGSRKMVEGLSAEQWEVLNARRRLEAGGGGEEGEGEEANKRLRIGNDGGDEDEEMQRLIAENQRNWEEMEREKQQQQQQQHAKANADATTTTTTNPQPTSTPSSSTGIFSTEAMGGLAYLQQLRASQAAVPAKATTEVAKAPAAPAARGLGGLAAYDSDSDDEGDEE